MQVQLEKEANEGIKNYLELSYRLVYDQIKNNWQYHEPHNVKAELEKRELLAKT